VIEPRAVSASVRYKRILLEKTGRLDVDVVFGPLILEKPLADATEDATRLAGEDILHRFRLTFDQRTRRIRMIPDSAEPIRSEPLRGIGIAFLPKKAGLEVAHIFPGTPGAASEIRKGDLLVEVDGTPVYERDDCSPAIPREADSVVLSFVRDGESISVEIAVVDLVP
ncbi:MAG: PDZ domain-containing protein, partial [Acidobacteriota bacterium]|nr:PDZ domain-containing protein [Acidobacteriota bacterium]